MIYQCRFCTLELNSESQRQNHENSRHPNNDRYFKCGDCGKLFGNEMKYQIHVNKMHPIKKDFSCPHCVKILNGAKQREEHIIASHPIHQCQNSHVESDESLVMKHSQPMVQCQICRVDSVTDVCLECDESLL